MFLRGRTSFNLEMSLIAQIINRLYHRPYLLMTNTVTGVLSISIGDVLQQNLENHWTNNNKNFDNVIGDEQNSTKRFQWDQKRTSLLFLNNGIFFSILISINPQKEI